MQRENNFKNRTPVVRRNYHHHVISSGEQHPTTITSQHRPYTLKIKDTYM